MSLDDIYNDTVTNKRPTPLSRIIKDGLTLGVIANLIPYHIPTSIRIACDTKEAYKQRTASEHPVDRVRRMALGFLVAVPTMHAQLEFYVNNSEYLSVLVGANICSGLYELGRFAKKKIEDRHNIKGEMK